MFLKKSMLLLFIISVVGCQTPQDRMREFVRQYNNSAFYLFVITSEIKSTHAELLNDTKIRIVFDSNIARSEKDKISFLQQIYPNILATVLNKAPNLMKLVNEEGAQFEFVLLSDDEAELINTLIDKKNIKELVAVSPNDSNLATTSKDGNAKSFEIEEILRVINKKLPYVSPKSGVKVSKIYLNDINELVYDVEANESVKTLLKMKDGKTILKETLLKNPELKTLYKGIKKHEILGVKYAFIDNKGNILTEINISRKELESTL